MYEQSVYMNLFDGETNGYFDDYQRFNGIVEELKQEGRRDLIDEGFDKSRVKHTVEVDMHYGVQLQTTTAEMPVGAIESKRDLLLLLKEFRDSYGENFGEEAHMPDSDINLRTIRVQSYVEQPRLNYTSGEQAVADGGAATPSTDRSRKCYFDGEFIEAPVYRFNEFDRGTIEGPAVVEHPETTIAVNDGWTFERTPNNVSYLRQ
jgi:N-methylhydantoinase A